MKPNLLILNRDGLPPSDHWYQIEVTGTHPVGDGRRQVIDDTALQSIVNRFKQDAEQDGFAGMLVDADHLSHDLENTTEALAWLKNLEIRNNQLYGQLELTDLGEAAVKGKRYKFFSTEYHPEDLEALPDKAVRPLRLAGLAFTNRPNNRGGQPISNRDGTLPPGETKPKTETNTPPMKSIAEKLGLSAEATEAEILAAIETLQGKVTTAETQVAETEADAVMNRFGSRVPEASRAHWKQELVKNRASAEKLMEASFPVQVAAPGRIFNRDGAAAPEPAEAAAAKATKEAEAKAAAIRNRASEISSREKIPFNQAFNRASAELA